MTVERITGHSHAERVTRVLEAFVDLPGDSHHLTAIADYAGLDNAVVHRILAVVIARGWVEQPEPRGPYRLGAHAAHFGANALVSRYEHVDPHQVLVDLQAACGGFVFYYTLAQNGARPVRFCSDFAAGGQSLDVFGASAETIFTTGVSLRAGASGRVLMAYAPQSVQTRVLAEPIPATAGPGALPDEELLSSLAAVRRDGYSLGRQECQPGWDSVAVPVLAGGAALGVVLLYQAIKDTSGDIADCLPQVQHAAHLISLAARQDDPAPHLAA
ncbi:IclR family transcriptional regulator C-terminal domain-containing protein [Streptomyces sp. NPDC050085]|uniref:helix-turn-helix domain-containing protein n=1 Tax=Streptomyces sp. NPDC050085 TaxID=3365600 RepID=UPI00378A1406